MESRKVALQDPRISWTGALDQEYWKSYVYDHNLFPPRLPPGREPKGWKTRRATRYLQLFIEAMAAKYNKDPRAMYRRACLVEIAKEVRRVEKAGSEVEGAIYVKIARLAIKLGEFQAAKQIIDTMVKSGYPHTRFSYTTLMMCHAHTKDFTAALKCWKQASEAGVNADSYICTVLIMAAGKAGMESRAFEIFESMKASGVVVTAPVFNALMRACQTPQRALSVFEKMAAHGEKGDKATLPTALSVCADAGDIETATKMWDVGVNGRGLARTQRAYNALLLVYSKAADPSRALGACKAFSEMRGAGIAPDSESYRCLLLSCRGNPRYLKVAKEALARAKSEGACDSHVCSAMMGVLCSARDAPAARALLDYMAERKIRRLPSTERDYDALISHNTSC